MPVTTRGSRDGCCASTVGWGGAVVGSVGAVTHLLDVLKGAGVTKFAIQIEKAPQ